MYDIGTRAAEAIEERAKRDGTKVSEECERAGISRQVYRAWKIKRNLPGGYLLRRMLQAGYDVDYILLGVKK